MNINVLGSVHSSVLGIRETSPWITDGDWWSITLVRSLFYMRQRTSVRRLIVDTGAEVSVVPATRPDRHGSPVCHRTGVDTSRIPGFAQRSMTFGLGLRRVFRREAFPTRSWGRFSEPTPPTGRHVQSSANRFPHQTHCPWNHFASASSRHWFVHDDCGPFLSVLRYIPQVTCPPVWSKPAEHTVIHHTITKGPPAFVHSCRFT